MVLLAGCDPQADLEQRTRRYFEMPASQHVNAVTIRSAILSGTPLGSSPEQVYAYLERRGIGKDGLSAYYPLNYLGAKDKIVCLIGYNPKTLGVVKNKFSVFFLMDRDQKLQDIQVQEWHTGL